VAHDADCNAAGVYTGSLRSRPTAGRRAAASARNPEPTSGALAPT